MTDTKRPLIYVVEDDVRVAQLIERTLLKFDFRCKLFFSGGDFLRQLRIQPPHITILDLGLPDMDALHVVSQLRTNYGFGLLIVTARVDTHDRVLGLELGADDYVTKPFEPRELIARVRSILRRYLRSADDTPAAPGSALFSGWRFDASRHGLTAPDGRDVSISAAEATMLLALLRNPNRILTREQLIGERNVDPYDRSIDVRISRLRRKLEDDPQNPRLIKTVYGAGYLFCSAVAWE